MARSRTVARDVYACCICETEYELRDGMLMPIDTPNGAALICRCCTKAAVAAFAELQRDVLAIARARVAADQG